MLPFKKCIFSLSIMLVTLNAIAQNPPKREFRGAWIATFFNIDWPASGATTAQEQSTFIQRVTEHKEAGMNAVIVQVRSQCDAMYASSIEPWSRDLTGTQGTPPNPYYDPLEFMITETRKQGMEFHAWFNPFRALSSATPANLAALHSSHVINTNPSWIMDCVTGTTTQKILNPGNPDVTNYIIRVVMDVVRRYDVDGIHMDDYFYPNPATTTYNDDAEFSLYSRGIANKNDWRRANIDSLVKRLGDSIRSVKPWVKYGYSPTGIWLSASGGNGGSNTSTGALQHHKDHFANSRLWQQQNWIDYLMPQVYWHIGQTGSDYANLIPWWNNNAFSRHIYIGMASYKVGVSGNGTFTTDQTQIPQQVRMNRANANINGSVYYNTTTLRSNTLGHRDSLRLNYYNKPALVPAMSWKTSLTTNAPTGLTVTPVNANTVTLNWIRPADGISEYQKVKRFVVYRSTTNPIDINNANNILTILWNDATTFTDNTLDGTSTYFYTVTALNRLQHESVQSAAASSTGMPLNLKDFFVTNSIENKVNLNWQTTNEVNVLHFEVEKSSNTLGDFKTYTIVKAKNELVNDYYVDYTWQTTEKESWFRLRMVDKDGSYKYSSILNVQNKTFSPSLVIKNTAIKQGENLIINFGDYNKEASYNILTLAGKQVLNGKCKFNQGNGLLSSINLNKGMYVIRLQAVSQQSATIIWVY